MFILVYLFCSLVAVSTLLTPEKNVRVVATVIIATFLIIFAGTRTSQVGLDYEEYIRLFTLYPALKGLEASTFILMEPAIVLIPNFFGLFFSSGHDMQATFLFFAVVSVSIKLYAIQKSRFFFLSFIVYFSYLYFGQEMITIRAGVACGIFLLAIDDLNNKNDRGFFLKIGIACLFHYSSLIFLIIWIVEKLKMNYKLLCVGIVVSFIIAVLKINLLTLLRLDVIFPKVRMYLMIIESEENVPVNIFNFKILFSLMFLLLFAYRIDLVKNERLFMILFKVHIISVIFFFALSPTAMVFSLRIYEMLSIVQILLYPFVIYLFKEKVVGYLILSFFCLINFTYTIYLSQLFEYGYGTWLL